MNCVVNGCSCLLLRRIERHPFFRTVLWESWVLFFFFFFLIVVVRCCCVITWANDAWRLSAFIFTRAQRLGHCRPLMHVVVVVVVVVAKVASFIHCCMRSRLFLLLPVRPHARNLCQMQWIEFPPSRPSRLCVCRNNKKEKGRPG